MKPRHFMLAAACLFTGFEIRGADLRRFEFSEPHMGTTVRLVLYAPDEALAKESVRAAFARVAELNRIMSDYDAASELMRLCANEAGTPVVVSADLFFVLSEGQKIARRSEGAFDMTIGPLVKLWRRSRLTQRLPGAGELAEAKSRTGYSKVELNDKDRTVRLATPGMQIDLGGIAKGYAADEILATLRKYGVTRALAAVGGDITAGDAPPDAATWVVAVAPLMRAKPMHRLKLVNAAVSTSGDREQFTIIDGVRYSHIVDPRTGLGQTGRRSVTVIARRGIIADATTKAVALMDVEKALELIEETSDAAALIVVDEKVRESKRLATYLK